MSDGEFDPYDSDQITAQDVVDALRLAFTGQQDPKERGDIADELLEFAPETDCQRGTGLLMRLIAEGTLRVKVR